MTHNKFENKIAQKNNGESSSINDKSCFLPVIVNYKYGATSPDSIKRKLIIRKLKKESLFIIRDTADKFYMAIDPLFNFELGRDMADSSGENLYKNTRGFIVRGNIGDKLAFESSFYENQATYAQYIDDYIFSTNKLFPQTVNYQYDVIPGQGRAKKFKLNGYDYAMASGYVSYSPIKLINIQIGHGKHFVGDGYRSLLLSDNSFNYPYARITTTYKNVQYTNLYTSFMNLTNGGVKTPPNVERLFQKKTASFQLLSINFFKRLQIGLFQGMIWEAADTTNRQHLSFNTFNPIIGVNTAVYGLHNTNNIVAGATLKIKITNSISVYGQYMLDDTYQKNSKGDIRKKYGYQIGLKYFDLFTIKNLHLQLEYNNVRPYAYASDNTYQSYTHYNQALAHPLGANFYEAVGFLNYRIKDFFIQLKGNYAVKGADSLNMNYGGNIFRSDNNFPINQSLENIQTTQGLKTTIMYQDIHVGYLVNPSTNFNIVLGIINRSEKTDRSNKQTQFIYFGIRTSLNNFYYDF
ncbi:MAG: capsule assembly Wzi family protein [Bacteroidia bacterium]|nr:capsule assembly Wzi family protein [Bacteroidia bacterium]